MSALLQGFHNRKFLNVLQWDNVVLGNADLALGADRLKVAQKTVNFPMLVGNVVSLGSTWPKFPNFQIIETGGFRIGGVFDDTCCFNVA
jgi:2',3'-cyclic-nucleotide 2'-phosphodiesterase (5'-nucleotidase family)|tara:strand:- start:1197 stop:1463 length:267 start_codon:yes stop_codon:yes gene_type:complete